MKVSAGATLLLGSWDIIHNVVNLKHTTVSSSDNKPLPDCPICYVQFHHADHIVSTTQCDHWFHPSCLKTWFATSQAALCPLCRVDCEVQGSVVVYVNKRGLGGGFEHIPTIILHFEPTSTRVHLPDTPQGIRIAAAVMVAFAHHKLNSTVSLKTSFMSKMEPDYFDLVSKQLVALQIELIPQLLQSDDPTFRHLLSDDMRQIFMKE
jgi:hypothetical protein